MVHYLLNIGNSKNDCYLFKLLGHKEIDEDKKEEYYKYDPIWAVYKISEINYNKYINNQLAIFDLYQNAINEKIDILIENKDGFIIEKQLTKEEVFKNYSDYFPSDKKLTRYCESFFNLD